MTPYMSLWEIFIAILALFVTLLVRHLFFTRNMSNCASLDFDGKNILFVTAHPDDECMFFGPSILNYGSDKHDSIPHVLCLSTGNFDGKGEERKKELVASCSVLGISKPRVKCLDHPSLQDGWRLWEKEDVADAVVSAVKEWDIDTIISFDERGVSGHPNHRSICEGIVSEIASGKRGDTGSEVAVWTLATVPFWFKYLRMFPSRTRCIASRCVVVVSEPHLSTMAMKQHATQWVWFRQFYVRWSRYMVENVLVKR